MYKRSPRGWAKHIDFILLDLLSLHVSFVIAYWIRNGFGALPYGDARYRVLSLVMTIVDVVVAVLLSTFSGVLRRGYYKEIAATIKHAAAVFAVLTYYLFLLQSGDQYSRIFFVVMMIIYALIGYSVRIVYRRLRRTSKGGRRSLLIIATESGAGQVAAALKSGPDKYAIAGIAVLDSNIIGKSIENIPVVAASDTVIDYVSKEWIGYCQFKFATLDSVRHVMLPGC